MADPRGTSDPARDDDPVRAETRDFLRELARDVSPVERIAPLRTAAARVLGLWLAVSLAAVVARGVTANLSDPERMLGGFGAVLAGLALVGLGGVCAALASAVPGREGVARAGAGVLLVGWLVALGLGGHLLRGDPSSAGPAPLASDVACLTFATIVSLLPAAGALAWVVRAAPPRPGATLAVVGVGCVALGAFTTQLGCPNLALRHLLVAHALAPVLGAALLWLPLWWGFRRLRPA